MHLTLLTKPASDLRIPLRSATLAIIEPSEITAFCLLECRASKLCDAVGPHENSSLDWTMMTTSQVPSCVRVLPDWQMQSRSNLRRGFMGDQTCGETDAIVHQIYGRLCPKLVQNGFN